LSYSQVRLPRWVSLKACQSNETHKDCPITIYDIHKLMTESYLKYYYQIRDSLHVGFYDMLNFDQLSQYVRDKDIIFNCAASTSHPFSMREPWIDLDVNSGGTFNLLEVIRRFNREARLIHLGTSTQLGRLQYRPADEKHPEFPLDIYSANKSVSEKYVLIYANAYEIRATVLRLSNMSLDKGPV